MTTEALAIEDQELQFKDTRVPFLKVATGGRGPADPQDPAWLKRYEVGTQFSSKQKGAYLLQRFYIVDISTEGKCFTLYGKGIGEVEVDPVLFSQANQLQEIHQTAEEFRYLQQEQEKQKEISNGGSEGAVRRSDVDYDGNAPA